jgi:hypothetical protein
MRDSMKSILFGVLVGMPTMILAWVFLPFMLGCESTNSCTGIHLPEMTSIPTLPAATMQPPKVGADAVSGPPKCRIEAVKLLGAWVNAGYSETEPFTFTDITGTTCTATFKNDVQQLFIVPNLWYNGAPACTTCHYADVKNATKNMDLSSYAGILAGSQRVNGEPQGNDILGGGDWEQALLHHMLYAPNGQTLIGRPAMPLGRPANVPANGSVVFAGTPPMVDSSITPEATPTP